MSFSKSLKVAVAALALSAFLAPTLSVSSAQAQASKPAVTKKDTDQKNVKKASTKKKQPAKKQTTSKKKKPAAKKAA